MEKPITVVEISNTEVRIGIGYENNDKINLVYLTERSIDGLISRGEIVDLTTLSSILSSMREFKDEVSKSKITVNDVTLILPSIGLNVFQSEKTTNIVSPYGVVAQIDIENVVSLVQKEAVPSGSEIIDIIPDSFTLEMGRSFINPPLNEHSNNIKINAKIHCLPTRVVSEYKRALDAAHIRVRRLCVSSYALAELGKHIEQIPNSYILVDMGSELTNISLIGNNTPFETITFQSGGSDLITRIVENFRISPEDALEVLKKYGYDERPLSFKPTIAKGNADGVMKEYCPEDLNLIIKTFFMEDYFAQFDVAFSNLMKGYPEAVRNLPIVFTGGFSNLVGFENLAKFKFSKNQSIHHLEPETFGARDAKFSAIIGAMYSASKYKGSLSDSRVKPNEFSRDKEQN